MTLIAWFIMPYCENCGAQVNLNTKFCNNCGAKQNANLKTAPTQTQPVSFTPPPPPPPPPQASFQIPPPKTSPASPSLSSADSDRIIGALVLRKPKSLGRYDAFTGVLTSQRFIFAQMTSEMLKDAAMQARDQAKAEGKGFFGQWSEQLKASFSYTRK